MSFYMDEIESIFQREPRNNWQDLHDMQEREPYGMSNLDRGFRRVLDGFRNQHPYSDHECSQQRFDQYTCNQCEDRY